MAICGIIRHNQRDAGALLETAPDVAYTYQEVSAMPSIPIPPGLCQCGCGQPTKISPYTRAAHGWVQGQPRRFITGHNTPRTRMDASPQLCACGCGQLTPLASKTYRSKGIIQGQPLRYIVGHNGRHPRPAVQIDSQGRYQIPVLHGRYALVDADYADLAALHWHLGGRGYVARAVKSEGRAHREYLHVVVLERKLGRPMQPGYRGDHIDGDTLNCTADNLREVTEQQNRQNHKRYTNNRTGINGVGLTCHGTFTARIKVKGRDIRLGIYKTLQEAAARRKQAEQEYPGNWRD